jgi:hypothetical protein
MTKPGHPGKAALRITRLLLMLASMMAAYLLVEVAYRAYQYRHIRRTLLEATMRQLPADEQGNSLFDPHTGYRYRPNIEVSSATPFPVAWKTNSHGHIARGEYTVAKPPGEFRIGLVGDSFTANVNNTIRWGDVLEDRLHASPEWSSIVDGRETRVINFGLDGIGLVQFDDVVHDMARPFQVDLLIVNLIREDVSRGPYYRGQTNIRSRQQLQRYVEDEVLPTVPLWSFYPEVFARTIGFRFGMRPRMSLGAGTQLPGGPRYFARTEDAVAASAAALRQITCEFPSTVFLVQPAHWGDDEPRFRDAFRALVRTLSGEVTFTDMASELPKPASDAEWDSWFNVPYDLHYSDRGVGLYGDAVARYLQRLFAGRHLGASPPPGQCDQVL